MAAAVALIVAVIVGLGFFVTVARWRFTDLVGDTAGGYFLYGFASLLLGAGVGSAVRGNWPPAITGVAVAAFLCLLAEVSLRTKTTQR